MNKLFSMEDIEDSETQTTDEKDIFKNLESDIQEYSSDLDISTERLNTATNNLLLVSEISNNMNAKKLASVDYFTSMENYRAVITTISNNLGIKSKVPSLEDFKNPYGTQASHDIAIEGFFSSIKTIWEKIKEIFAAFFKKIMVFFKRLLNAQLDLETYDEYLEKMIAKIKTKKMVVSDNKVIIDSKLPSMLANPGMESVNSDFILITGENKIKRLVMVSNRIFQDTLNEVSGIELDILKKQIKGIINEISSLDYTVEEAQTHLDGLRTVALGGLSKIFQYQINDIRDLPEKVYNDAYNHFDRSDMEDVSIRSLVDTNNMSDSLPKNFNSFFISSKDEKVFVSSSVETNTYVENKLSPIAVGSNLVKFYEFYKKFSKDMDIKKIDKSIGNFQDGVDEIINLMKHDYVSVLESLRTRKTKVMLSEKINTFAEALTYFIKFCKDLRAIEPDPRKSPYVNYCYRVGEEGEFDSNFLYRIIEDEEKGVDIEEYYENIFMTVQHKDRFIKEVKDIFNEADATAIAGSLSKEDLEIVVKEFESFQKFLLNYFNSIQTTLKEVSVNLAGTYVELRYEFARYLYNSAKLYVAN